jgi:hypothetical protein
MVLFLLVLNVISFIIYSFTHETEIVQNKEIDDVECELDHGLGRNCSCGCSLAVKLVERTGEYRH